MKRTAIIAVLIVGLSLQTARGQAPEPIDDDVLQFAIQTQWELYQDVPINRVPFLGSHNSYADRNYTLNDYGKLLMFLSVTVGFLLPTPILKVLGSLAGGMTALQFLLGIDNPDASGSVLRNQEFSFNQMLDAGVRAIELDAHLENGRLVLCHSKVETCNHEEGPDAKAALLTILKNPKYNFYAAVDNLRGWVNLPEYSNQLLVIGVENFVGKTCTGYTALGNCKPGPINRDRNAMVSQYIASQFSSLLFTPGDLRNWRLARGYPEADPALCLGAMEGRGHYPTVREVLRMGKRVILQEDQFALFEEDACRGVGVRFPRFGTYNYYEFAASLQAHCDTNYVYSGKPDPTWVSNQTVGCVAGREFAMANTKFLQGINADNERLCPLFQFFDPLKCMEISPAAGRIHRDEAQMLTQYNAPVINPDFISTDTAYGTIWTFRGPTEPVNPQGSNRCVYIDRFGHWRNGSCSTPRKRVCKVTGATFEDTSFVLRPANASCEPELGPSRHDPPRTPEQNQKVVALLNDPDANPPNGDLYGSEAWINWDVCAGKGCFSVGYAALQRQTPPNVRYSSDHFLNVRSDARADVCVFTGDDADFPVGIECYPVGVVTDTPVLRYQSPPGFVEFGTKDDRLFVDVNGDNRTDICVVRRTNRPGAGPPIQDPTAMYCFLVAPGADGEPATLRKTGIIPGGMFSFVGVGPGNRSVRLLVSDVVSTGLSGAAARDWCNVWLYQGNTSRAPSELQVACTAMSVAADGSIVSALRTPVTYKHKFGPFRHRNTLIDPAWIDGTTEAYATAFADVTGDRVTDLCTVFVRPYNTSADNSHDATFKARQNICLVGAAPRSNQTVNAFQANNLVVSEVYVDGEAMSQEIGGGRVGTSSGRVEASTGGRWVDFNGDRRADLCVVTIASASDDANRQFPIVRCEPTYRLPTGKVVFRGVALPGTAERAAERFMLLPGGNSPSYNGQMFKPGENVYLNGSATSLKYSLFAGDMNGDAIADFCSAGVSAGADYVSCMFSQAGAITLPRVATTVALAPGIYGREAQLRGPLAAAFQNLNDTTGARSFGNVNGDGTRDYCIGVSGGRSLCWNYFAAMPPGTPIIAPQ